MGEILRHICVFQIVNISSSQWKSTFTYAYTLKPAHTCTHGLQMQWPMFFSDVLQCVGNGVKESVELYLRVLMAIDEEVVDRQKVHTCAVS